MNANEAQQVEIPADWDVTVSGAEKRGYRRGVEEMLEECRKYWAYMSWGKESWKAVPLIKIEEAARLLGEGEGGKKRG